MKKRLLALALCLVMMTSLLPLTAAADACTHDTCIHITGTGFVKYDSDVYVLENDSCSWKLFNKQLPKELYGITSKVLYQDETLTVPVKDDPVDGETYYLKYQLHSGDFSPEDFIASHPSYSPSNCFLEIPGYTASCSKLSDLDYDDINFYIAFKVTKHKHNWQFTQTDSTLTGTCGGCGKEVSVSLKADSVTLPKSPFNARLEGQSQFETATGAAISKIRYDYKGSDGVWHKGVDPVSANAKAGEYQAFVQISNLPRSVESDGVVAMAENPDGTYTADLFVKYTAVDPAITAQTGDNRPIELMMGSVVLFSALAAAAFVADSKRRSRQ